jgi:hypothetical protein
MTTFNIDNVVSFRGFDVRNGQVDISESEYCDYLDEVYPDPVEACGMTFTASRVLQKLDAVAFRCDLGDYESGIQSELEEAIENEDDSDIVWEDGKEPSEQDE